MDEIRYIAGTLVGAGVDIGSLDEALKENPHFIACDAGTTDAGPFSLGSGQPAFAREAVKRDIAAFLDASHRAGIPVLIGSAGTAGEDGQVDWTLDIVNEIVREMGIKLRVAVIYAEQDKDALVEVFRQGRLKPLDAAPHVDELPPPTLMTVELPKRVTLAESFRGVYTRRTIMLLILQFFQAVGFYGFGSLAPIILVAKGFSVVNTLAYTAPIALGYPLGSWLSVPIVERNEK